MAFLGWEKKEKKVENTEFQGTVHKVWCTHFQEWSPLGTKGKLFFLLGFYL